MKRLMIIAIMVACGTVFAQTNEAILEETTVVCASHLGIAAILTDVELSEMIFTRDGKWWRSVLVELTSDAEADRRIGAAMEDLQARWNSNDMTWGDLLDISQNCSEAKLSIEGSK